MRRLARFVILRRWWVIVTSGVVVVGAALVGGGVAEELTLGGFSDPSSESAVAADVLADEFDAGRPELVAVVTATDGDVDTGPTSTAGVELTGELDAAEGVADAFSYWTLDGAAPLRSDDGTQALVIVDLVGEESEQLERAAVLSEEFSGGRGGPDSAALSVQFTGVAEVTRQVAEQSESDLQKAELLAAPFTVVALIVVFGTVVSAFLPLVVGVVAVIGTLLVLTVIAGFTEVSVFALNVTTAMGLGLGIDYSLFVVSRYREELESGLGREVALSRTMQTAGRTVAFSAATVMTSLLALLLFPIPYLRSFAYAGVAVVGLAALAAIVVLPAVLAVLGERVEAGRVLKKRSRDGRGFWYRQAHRVMAHPIPYLVGVGGFLLLLALPFFHLSTGSVDDRVVPDSVSGRAASDDIREGFSSRESSAFGVVVRGGGDGEAALDELARTYSGLDGVARVDGPDGFYVAGERVAGADAADLDRSYDNGAGDSWLSVVPDLEPISAEGEALVTEIREVEHPFPEVLVGGAAAELADTKAVIGDRLGWAIAFIALATFALLFFMMGSLLVPLKALVLNTLSLTATFGAMVWIFQDGNFADQLGITTTGFIDVSTPLLMFCIAFGLSMDYEVFLLSRIKEEYDLEHDNTEAVAVGLEHTGRIVTAAALLLAIVFLAMATSDVSIVKLFGLGLTLAVLVDAFLIRATLVPAAMKLAGRANWWAPRALRRFHLRYGIWENEPIDILDRDFEADEPAP